ncbi:hypothetical protein CRYUN_Cryun01aG0226500 [Craigia yunnanensis]
MRPRNLVTWNTMIFEEARWVFNKVFYRDLVLLNVMVSCYALNSLTEEAFQVFDLMKKEDVPMVSALVDMYVKSGNLSYA